MLAGPATLEKWAIATAVLTAFREICELPPNGKTRFSPGRGEDGLQIPGRKAE
jgi:hypothetical protein